MIPILARALPLLTVLLAPLASALPEDRDQPIEISADRAEIDDATGTATYYGDVRMDQGTMRVSAATLTIETVDDAVTRITAEGEDDVPARYQQTPELDAEDVQANARTIIYLLSEERLELQGEAELRQNEDRFEGDRITYDLRERKVAASSAIGGGPVNFTISPSRLRASEPDPSSDN